MDMVDEVVVISTIEKIANTYSCINVKNQDNECFRYAMLAKLVSTHPERPSRANNKIMQKYNFRSLTYPVSINEISVFEKQF